MNPLSQGSEVVIFAKKLGFFTGVEKRKMVQVNRLHDTMMIHKVLKLQDTGLWSFREVGNCSRFFFNEGIVVEAQERRPCMPYDGS